MTVTSTTTDAICQISLHRPPVNALDLDTINAMISAIEQAGTDPSVRAIIVCSTTPGCFCAGLDLGLMLGRSAAEVRQLLKRLYVDLHLAHRAAGKPTIASIEGAARGAGMTMAIACDVVVCSETATFGYPEIDVGLIPGIHFVHLPSIIGRQRAFELLFGGKPFGSGKAKELGLVNEVTPPGRAFEAAHNLALLFSTKAPGVMRSARDAFTRAHSPDYVDRVNDVIEEFCKIAVTAEAQEGLLAFSQRRAPSWSLKQ